MAEEAIDVLLNLELLYKNKIRLDLEYHEPDNFLLESNNLIRNAIFVIEKATKSKTQYPWLKNYIHEFIQDNKNDYQILKTMRNNSMHQEFLISKATIEFGLYKIVSSGEYVFKLGMGDFNKEANIHPSYLYSSTSSFFQEILFLHQYLFIDLERNAFNECLGVTRRWLCRVTYKSDDKTHKTVDLDIYDTITKFVSNLIFGISNAFKEAYSLDEDRLLSCYIAEKYNCINTILEVDLYPEFFKQQWGAEIQPLNVRFDKDYWDYNQYNVRNKGYLELINNLPKLRDEYFSMLEKYSSIKIEDFQSQQEYNQYVYFITFPHFYIKNFLNSNNIFKINLSLFKLIQKFGLEYVKSVDQNFDGVDNEEKNKNLRKIGSAIMKLREHLKANLV